MKWLLISLLSASAFALQPHSASYTLSMLGLEIATEKRVLSKNNGIYHYQEKAQTTGLAKTIKDYQIDAESTFTISESGIQAQHYQLFERDGDSVKKDINIQLTPPQIDPLSLFLALAHALENNPNQRDFYFSVNDGKKIEQHHYQQIPSDGSGLIKIINTEKQIEGYFDKNRHYLPVHINKKQFSYQLKTLKMLD